MRFIVVEKDGWPAILDTQRRMTAGFLTTESASSVARQLNAGVDPDQVCFWLRADQ